MMTFPIYGKIKKVPNHQPETIQRSLGLLPWRLWPHEWRSPTWRLLRQTSRAASHLAWESKGPLGIGLRETLSSTVYGLLYGFTNDNCDSPYFNGLVWGKMTGKPHISWDNCAGLIPAKVFPKNDPVSVVLEDLEVDFETIRKLPAIIFLYLSTGCEGSWL